MNVARSTLKVFTARATSKLVGFLGIIFFAQELGSGVLGIFFLFQALLGMLSIPADIGLSEGVVKRLSEGESEGEVVATALALKLLPIAVIAAIIGLFRSQINAYLGADLALLLALALFLQETAILTMQILRGQLRVGATALPMLGRQLGYIGVGVVLVLLGGGVRELVYGLLVGILVMLAAGVLSSRPAIGAPSVERARSIVSYSKYAFVSAVGGYFYSWMDVLVIGYILTSADVGVYEVSWRVTSVVMLFSHALATTVFPQVSQWSAADAVDQIENMLPEAIALSLVPVVPAFVGTVLFGEEILGLIFGSEFTDGALVLTILMSEKLLQSVHIILGRALQGLDHADLAARAGIVAMTLNLGLNVILVFQYGIVGAAIATLLSFAVNSLLHGYYLSRFLSIRVPVAQIAGIVGASGAMGVGLFAVNSVYIVDSLVRLGTVVILGVIMYITFIVAVPSLRRLLVENARRALR